MERLIVVERKFLELFRNLYSPKSIFDNFILLRDTLNFHIFHLIKSNIVQCYLYFELEVCHTTKSSV